MEVYMEKILDADEIRKEYEFSFDEIIDEDEDYFDIRKIEQNNVDYEYKSKIYDKENPYR